MTGDSLLSNINERRSSKSKEGRALKYPRATRNDLVENIDKVLEDKQKICNCWLCWYNSMTSSVRPLSIVKQTFIEQN